ncbi:MAG: hypothetical protein IJF07_01280 [Lachnospiraceae bacterium]|nr:hypothetical protein [Lachnospiraceae bacterium]
MLGSTFGNIIGTLYFLIFQSAGILLFSLILKKEGALTRILLGSAFGSLLLHWLPILFSFFLDFTIVSHILALLVLLPIFIIAFRQKECFHRLFRDCLKRICYHKGFFIALTGTFLLWIYLLSTHIIPISESGAVFTGQSTYGDMNMHLGFITSIANQHTFPPDYSLFPGTKLSYPFLNASISSSIYLMGASLRYAYILPMITAFLQVTGSVYLLAVTLFGSRTKALLTYLFYFFNGGLGFIYFMDFSPNHNLSISDIFTGFYTTPTNLVDYNVRWANIIADILLPQRASLFGYALLFPCIWLLHQAVFHNKKNFFLLAGIFASALPMIHTHSFLGIGLISAAWLLLFLYRSVVAEEKRKWFGTPFVLLFVPTMCLLQHFTMKNLLDSQMLLLLGILGITGCMLYGSYLLICYVRKNGCKELLTTWGRYLLCVILLAFPQLFYWTFGQVAEGGFLRGHFNWGNLGDFYPWFYLKNMGVVLFLILGAVCAGGKKSSHLILPAAVIWFVAELILFTPNTYDNNKLLYIAYLLLCLAAADYAVDFYQLLHPFGGRRLLAGCFLFLSTISAVLTLHREVISEYQLYSTSHLELVHYIEEHTKPGDVFLTNDRHNNEIASLTGRNIVCGADTFLYFHGIDTSQRKEHVRLMYEAPSEHLDLFTLYNVSYVVLSSWEYNSYDVDSRFFQEHFETVFCHNDIILYSVK